MADPDSIKSCARCGAVKGISEFPARNKSYCFPCLREYRRQDYLQNSERYRQQKAAWRAANKERYLESARRYGAKHKDKIALRKRAYDSGLGKDRALARSRRWRENNIEKARANEQAYRDRNRSVCNGRIRIWKQQNPHLRAEDKMRRLAAEVSATPGWANRAAIREVYHEASLRRMAGENVQVDHVVPLRSRLVCGLHCEQNLQLVSSSLNRQKSNLRWPDMPDEGVEYLRFKRRKK